MRNWLTPLAMITAVTVTAAAAVISAPRAVGSERAPAVQEAWTAVGVLHPVGRGGWCLTAADGARDQDAVFVLPCVPHDKWQRWFMWRVTDVTHKIINLGGMSIESEPDLSAGQSGRTDETVRTLNALQHPQEEIKTLLSFNDLPHGWVIHIPHFHGWFLSVTKSLRAGGNPVATARWLPADKAGTQIQYWALPVWHRLSDRAQIAALVRRAER